MLLRAIQIQQSVVDCLADALKTDLEMVCKLYKKEGFELGGVVLCEFL